METKDYEQKIRDLLEPGTYKKLQKDPTKTIVRKVNKLVKLAPWDESTKKRLQVSEVLPPILYGLQKIHKPSIPLRPIISAIGSPTYDLAKYLAKLLKPFIGKTDTHVKDSAHFIDKISTMTITTGDILVSFDVVSLFTKVPLQDTMQHLEQFFPADIISLFKLCLTETYFQWKGEYYEPLDGVAMGNPLSPVIASF